MTGVFSHTTVMLRETVEAIAPRSGGIYVDVTLGGAGHARAILEASAPDGRMIGVDRDPAALEAARSILEPFGERATLVHGEMGSLGEVLSDLGVAQIDGLVADLGVSSPQLDNADRGFSFNEEGPLDMRMDPTKGETALELISRLSADDLADVIFQFGDERRSRPIARSIKRATEAGELTTTSDLERAVRRVMGPRRSRINPATRTFQAIRIAVNAELEQLELLTQQLATVLADGAVAVIISFHSLEDRIVKRSFRENELLVPLTKRPLVADEIERGTNPRSRSAKLRAARRLPRSEAA